MLEISQPAMAGEFVIVVVNVALTLTVLPALPPLTVQVLPFGVHPDQATVVLAAGFAVRVMEESVEAVQVEGEQETEPAPLLETETE